MSEHLTTARTARKLLFVITSLDYGGAEAVVVELASRFRERGWEVGVVSMVQPRAYEEELSAAGVKVYSLNMPKGVPDPRAVLRLAAIYRQHRPDVVHSHMVHANLLARVARLLGPVPALISTAHNITEGGFALNLGYRLTDSLTEFTTNVSQAAFDRYVKIGLVGSHKSGYVPNGINLQRYAHDSGARERLRKELSAGAEFVWLAVGRITEQKDYPNLFSALKLQPSSSVVWLVGDGELREASEETVRREGLEERVRFLGVRSDVGKLMSAADGFVLASAWEGLPMVLLEAAASNLPAVATDVGGVAEIVRPEAGLLIPARNPRALADAMSEMEGAPPALRLEMGRVARQIALANFDIGSIVSRWEALFDVALRASGGRRKRLASRLHTGTAKAVLAGSPENS